MRGIATRVLMGFLLIAAGRHAEAEKIPFDSDRWTMTSGRVEEYLGVQSLVGGAELKSLVFDNGVIEVDVAVDGRRCFPGIVFRVQDEGNLEDFYIRPHKPKMPDALQYTPVTNGLGSWQLYNGRGFTAAADIPNGKWIHIRLEVLGTRARVFFDDMQRPALVINDLRHGKSRGWVGLRAPAGGEVHFANFEIHLTDDLDLGPVPRTAPAENMVTSWQISQPFDVSQVDRMRVPEVQDLPAIEWKDAAADARGLVDIARHVVKKPMKPEVVLARSTIIGETEGVQKLSLGYSDEVSLFVNGELFFSGNSAFRSRDEQFQGIVGLHDAVYPRLKRGPNELLLMITDTLGGWGFMCRLSPVEGAARLLHDTVSPKWDIEGRLKAPESVAYDVARDVLYVSNYSPGAPPGTKAGFLSRVSPSGEIIDLEWVRELNGPTGVAVLGDRVFVVEREGVVVVDADSAEIVARTPCPSEGMLNDIASGPDGVLYVSDSRNDVIYRMSEGSCEPWLSGWPLEGPNGLLVVDGGIVVVGNLRGGNLLFINRESKTVEANIELGPGLVDGVRPDGQGSYIVSQFEGRVLRVRPSGEIDVLVDTSASQTYCADLEYVAERNLIVVPTLYDNQLIAYQLGSGTDTTEVPRP